jgi:hypothetical protein
MTDDRGHNLILTCKCLVTTDLILCSRLRFHPSGNLAGTTHTPAQCEPATPPDGFLQRTHGMGSKAVSRSSYRRKVHT